MNFPIIFRIQYGDMIVSFLEWSAAMLQLQAFVGCVVESGEWRVNVYNSDFINSSQEEAFESVSQQHLTKNLDLHSI